MLYSLSPYSSALTIAAIRSPLSLLSATTPHNNGVSTSPTSHSTFSLLNNLLQGTPRNSGKSCKSSAQMEVLKIQGPKPQLLPSDEFLYLVLTLKKIAPKGRTNPYKIPLPHPLHSPHESKLCLFIDDCHGRLTSKDAKEKIASEGIPISKIIKLSKLKFDYKPFEAKRKLCDSYDMFFADKRVIPLLPKLLGKHFYKKRKIPVLFELGHRNWKEQIESACGSTFLFLKTGTCSVVRVGKGFMEGEGIVENVGAAINRVVDAVLKKEAGKGKERGRKGDDEMLWKKMNKGVGFMKFGIWTVGVMNGWKVMRERMMIWEVLKLWGKKRKKGADQSKKLAKSKKDKLKKSKDIEMTVAGKKHRKSKDLV
ncbi:hypothetical protein Ancab_039337 [Ancistrocladus abbreviatus]